MIACSVARIRLSFLRVGTRIVFLATTMSFFGFAQSGAGKAMRASKEELRAVDLETTAIIRSIKHLTWKERHLPPADEEVVLLVVGHDVCLFKERLAFLIENDGTSISGRKIRVESRESINSARKAQSGNAKILMVCLLESVSKDWTRNAIPDQQGLVLFGQGEIFRRQGLSLCSRIENNRIRLSVNLKKLNGIQVEVDHGLFFMNPVFRLEE